METQHNTIIDVNYKSKTQNLNLEVRIITDDGDNSCDKKVALFSKKEDAILFSKEKEKELAENESIDIVNVYTGIYIYQTPPRLCGDV